MEQTLGDRIQEKIRWRSWDDSGLKAGFYESALRKDELEKVLMPMLKKYDVAAVDDPDGVVRWRALRRSEAHPHICR